MGLPGRQGSVRPMNFEPMFVDSQSPDFLSFRFSGQHVDWQRPLGRVGGRGGLEKALLGSAVGISARLLLRLPFSLPEPSTTLDVWNEWPRPATFVEPEPDDGPLLVTVEYKIDPVKAQQFLGAIHLWPPVRRTGWPFPCTAFARCCLSSFS